MKRKTLISISVVALVLLAMTITPLLAQNGNVWNVSYFANPNWAAPAAMGIQSSYIDFNWGTVPPGPGLPATNWTATMTSSAYFYYTGTYVFQALADDEISLQIDGVTYINTIGAGMSGKTVQVAVPLNLGMHNLTVQYRQYTGVAYVYLNWAYVKPAAATSTRRCPCRCRPEPRCRCRPAQHRRRRAIPGGRARVRPRPPASPPSTATMRPASSRIFINRTASSPMANGTPRISGSIQMEPQIQVWGNCTPGQLQCMQLACNQAPVEATCSKTGAGWFYYGPCPALMATPAP